MPVTEGLVPEGSTRGPETASFVPRYWTSSSMMMMRRAVCNVGRKGERTRNGESDFGAVTKWQCGAWPRSLIPFMATIRLSSPISYILEQYGEYAIRLVQSAGPSHEL